LQRGDLWREAAFMAGEWRTGSARIAVDNPATGAVIGHVPDLGAAEAEEAVAAAQPRSARAEGKTAKERGAVLKRWAALMLEHADDLATIMTAEQGKPLAEAKAKWPMPPRSSNGLARKRGASGRCDRAPARPAAGRHRQPVGVVGAITPWNFPLAMITRKAARRWRWAARS
jgi:succinate-semialdehyde dehydrogenase/glutarate-semialdehyde dehydrogenase